MDELERLVQTENIIRGQGLAAGAEGVELIDLYEVREEFDRELAAEPVPVTAEDNEKHILMTALGLK